MAQDEDTRREGTPGGDSHDEDRSGDDAGHHAMPYPDAEPPARTSTVSDPVVTGAAVPAGGSAVDPAPSRGRTAPALPEPASGT
ncbi:hypothetical protein [Streptomyces fumanus]|uniref:Uncharacterized protein n=1 Tax=Streptomyces fumanus TaxID=67302 RepID=A0A919B1P3_9ACTN|nr:hypothetical protein [Streptomyces fumanus]GHF34385.1 hypothetical protein GCM10018772_70040 [Streptomyces fumanus]